MFFGPFWSRHEAKLTLTDLNNRERWLLMPLGLLSLLFGLFPNLVFNLSHAAVTQWLAKFSVA